MAEKTILKKKVLKVLKKLKVKKKNAEVMYSLEKEAYFLICKNDNLVVTIDNLNEVVFHHEVADVEINKLRNIVKLNNLTFVKNFIK